MTTKQAYRFSYLVADALSSFAIAQVCLGSLAPQGILLPLFYLLFWGVTILSGYYNEPLSKSRLLELWTSLLSMMLFSTLFLLSVVLLGGAINIPYIGVYPLCFSVVYILRLTVTWVGLLLARRRNSPTKVCLLSEGKIGQEIRQYLNSSSGYHIAIDLLVDDLPKGETSGLRTDIAAHLAKERGVEEIIIAMQPDHPQRLLELVFELLRLGLPIKLSARSLVQVGLKVEVSSMYGEPLVDVSRSRLSQSERNIKWLLDKVLSGLGLLALSPLFLFLMLVVKLDSRGRIFYRQERLGLHGKPFTIYKFRSMCEGAEPDCPLLSYEGDRRITRSGRWMRRYRLDELPQLWNVLRGDMSIVGPRPERAHYAAILAERVPHYRLLSNIKPGITSWGIVRYGYASTVEEMLERFAYDWIYYENISLRLDAFVCAYTLKTLLLGRGR